MTSTYSLCLVNWTFFQDWEEGSIAWRDTDWRDIDGGNIDGLVDVGVTGSSQWHDILWRVSVVVGVNEFEYLGNHFGVGLGIEDASDCVALRVFLVDNDVLCVIQRPWWIDVNIGSDQFEDMVVNVWVILE